MSAAQYLDTHDRCLTADSPAIAPISLVPSGENGLLATYYCPTCHERWTCGWSIQEEVA